MPFAKAAPRPGGAQRPRVASHVVANALRGIVETGAPAVVPCEGLGNGVPVGAAEAVQATKWLAGAEEAPGRLLRLGLIG
jgi:hypothetical protein